MPRDCDYVYHVADRTRLRVRFRIEGNTVTEFVVQLETELDGNWQPVVRYDSAHGEPHMDLLDREGREIEKRWLPGPFNDALTEGTKDLKANWKRYLARFLEET